MKLDMWLVAVVLTSDTMKAPSQQAVAKSVTNVTWSCSNVASCTIRTRLDLWLQPFYEARGCRFAAPLDAAHPRFGNRTR